MQNITTHLLKMILVCIFVSPLTNIDADTSLLLQERQRVINHLAQGQQKINQYQAESSARLEAERQNREYQQGLILHVKMQENRKCLLNNRSID
jgi:hypothetical protein